jgi:hypothetical protein
LLNLFYFVTSELNCHRSILVESIQ